MASIIKADTLQSTTANVFILNSSGTEYARFDSSGNMGIGTATPSAPLDVKVGTGNFTVGLQGAGNALLTASSTMQLDAAGASSAMVFKTVGTERMRIDSSGNVGVGTTTPAYLVDVVKASAGSAVRIWDNTTSSPAPTLYLQRGTNATWGADNYTDYSLSATAGVLTISSGESGVTTERARIDASGRLLVGKTAAGDFTAGVELQPSGVVLSYRTGNVAAIFGRSNDGETVRFYNVSSTVGTISTTASATAYNTSSDYRLKHDIAPMTGALAKVAALKPVTYKWNVDASDGQGFIAHELDEVVKGCVTGAKDAIKEEQYEVTPAVKDEEGNIVTEAVMGTRTVPVYQGIDTSFLVATLTAAIQEQQALIQALTATTTSQTEAITALTARIAALESTP